MKTITDIVSIFDDCLGESDYNAALRGMGWVMVGNGAEAQVWAHSKYDDVVVRVGNMSGRAANNNLKRLVGNRLEYCANLYYYNQQNKHTVAIMERLIPQQYDYRLEVRQYARAIGITGAVDGLLYRRLFQSMLLTEKENPHFVKCRNCVANGMAELARYGIGLWDVWPANIMIDPGTRAYKLIDYFTKEPKFSN